MEQTSVEWLQELNQQVNLNDEDFKKAIEMEIRQIQDACSKVYENEKSIEISDFQIKEHALDLMYKDRIISIDSFIEGAKWYRSHLNLLK